MRLLFPISRTPCTSFRRIFSARCVKSQMGAESLSLIQKSKHASFRLINVSGFKTDLLEIHSQNPKLHVLFIPGNPGVISFYTDFLESLYELLGGTASVTGELRMDFLWVFANIPLIVLWTLDFNDQATGADCFLLFHGEAIGHISHSEKDWESGRLFSLQEQISHKISFIEQELEDVEVPIVLVGHSIGSYISLDIFRRYHEKVMYCIGLYPFLALNTESSTQSSIRKITALPALCAALSFMGALLGMLPARILTFLVRKSIGRSWSFSAVEVLCTYVLQYHTLRNMLFMAMTEFQELPEKPDWDFIKAKKSQIAFLFGLDDHWGPLHLYEEICKQVPDLSIKAEEHECHTHAFSCTEAGSLSVAQHVSSLIKNNLETAKSI